MPFWDNDRRRGASNREFGWVGTGWGGGPIDAAERLSTANSTEEVIGFQGKEEGHGEDGGLNLTEFVRDPGFLCHMRRSIYS
jgi:hypothetical protein